MSIDVHRHSEMDSYFGLVWEDTFPLLSVTGAGTRAFLHGQTSVDLLSAQDGVLIRGCWLTATARVRALLEIRFFEETADVLVLAGNVQELAKGFQDIIFPADQVELKPLGVMRRVQNLSPQNFGKFQEVVWLNSGQSLSDVFEGCKSASKEEVERWRLEIGLPIGSGELNGETNPYELGVSDLVSTTKGCYLGQETIAKLARVGVGKQQLRFWRSENNVSTEMALEDNISSSNVNRKAGRITSAVKEADGSGSFGLAMVHRDFLSEKELFTSNNCHKVKISIPPGFVS